MSVTLTSAPEAPAAPLTIRRPATTSATQPVLNPWLRAQALNLARHTHALRDFRPNEFGSGAGSPTEGHIGAVNHLMAKLRSGLLRRAVVMQRLSAGAIREPSPARLTRAVTHKHEAHDSVRKIEKIWDFYLELFGQRQSPYGTWLLACDRIALDCYQAAYLGIGKAKSVPAPPPFCYMRTGFGPATFRRGIRLSSLARELNPFPLVQLPYHRLVNPWTLGAVLHEVGHNLQSDLGLNLAIPRALARRLVRAGFGTAVAQTWTRWNRETFCDLSGLLLGGPGIVASLMDVVGRSPDIVYTFSPDAVHPTPYLRVLLSTNLLGRMGFTAEAQRYAAAWKKLYPAPQSSNLPAAFLRTAPHAIALIVDTICYQPFGELGGKRLADIFRFAQKEQRMIEEAANRLGKGTDPGIVPARFLIGAARFAIDNRLAAPEIVKKNFYQELARR